MKQQLTRPTGQIGLWGLAVAIQSMEGLDPNVQLMAIVLLGIVAAALQWYGDRQQPPSA